MGHKWADSSRFRISAQRLDEFSRQTMCLFDVLVGGAMSMTIHDDGIKGVVGR